MVVGRKPKGEQAMTGAQRQAVRMERLRRIEAAAVEAVDILDTGTSEAAQVAQAILKMALKP